MPPDLLNSREDAILLWVIVIVGYAVYQDRRGIGSAFWNVARAIFTSELLLLFGGAALYSAAIVYMLARADLWHTTSLKETIYWYLGIGVVLAGNATQATPNTNYIRKVLTKLLTVTLVIEFVVNLYVFPIGVEIVIVFLTLVFTMMRVLADYDSKINDLTKKVIDGVLIFLGVLVLLQFVVGALSDLDGFFSRETAEDFLVVPVLTIALIPYLYLVAWYSRRELEVIRGRFRTGNSEVGG